MRKNKRLRPVFWGSTLAAIVVLAAAGAILKPHDQERAAADTNPKVSPAATVSVKPSPTKTPTPIPTEHVDVAIVGSELEGMYLARAAADEGLKVKVIDPRAQVGGQLLQGQMLFLDETRDDQYHSLVQGRVKELFDGFKSGKIRKLPEFTSYYNQLAKDIPIESGAKLEKVDTKPAGSGVQNVTDVLYSTPGHDTERLTADYWVDNTDDAALASKLNVTRLPGLEALYGEDHIDYQSASIMMKFKNVDWAAFSKEFNALSSADKAKKYGSGTYIDNSFAIGLSGVTSKFVSSNDRVHLRGLNAVNQRDGEVLINALLVYGVDPSNDQSVAEAVALGKQEMPGILALFRKSLTGWDKAELNGYPDYLYIREYNHYETNYVLQVSDLMSGRMFPDNVSIGGYPIDLQGTMANKWGLEAGRPDKYGMPLRSFELKGYDNMLLAGKNVGASALAYGSARIQPNTSLAAESIGVILGQIHGKKKLSELTDADWPALHAYLQSKYHITLTGVVGKNKIAGWTADEISKLNTGKIIYTIYVRTRKP